MHPLEGLIVLITIVGGLVQLTELVLYIKTDEAVLQSSSALKLSYRNVYPYSFDLTAEQKLEMSNVDTVGQTANDIVNVYPIITKSGSVHELLHTDTAGNNTWANAISSSYKGAVLTSYRPLNLTGIAVMRKDNMMFGFFRCSATKCDLHTSIYYCGTFMEDDVLKIKLRSTIAPIVEYTTNLVESEEVLKSLPLIQTDGTSTQMFFPWRMNFVDVPNPADTTTTTKALVYDVGGAKYIVNKGLETQTSSGSTLVFEKYVYLEPTENDAYIEKSFTQYKVAAKEGTIILILVKVLMVGTLLLLSSRYLFEIFLSCKGYPITNFKAPAIIYGLNRNVASACLVGLTILLDIHFSDYMLIHFYSQSHQMWNVFVIVILILLLQQTAIFLLLPVVRLCQVHLKYQKALIIYAIFMAVPMIIAEVGVLIENTGDTLFHRSDETLYNQIVANAITGAIGPKKVLVGPGEFKAHIFAEGSSLGTILLLVSWALLYAVFLVGIFTNGLVKNHEERKLRRTIIDKTEAGEGDPSKVARGESMVLSDDTDMRIRGAYKTCLENSIEFDLDHLYGVFPDIERRTKAGPYWVVTKAAMMFLGFYIYNEEILVERSFCLFYYAHKLGLGGLVSSILPGQTFTLFRIQSHHVDGRSGRIVYYGSIRWKQLLEGSSNFKIEPVG
jgi:hypothetical protein